MRCGFFLEAVLVFTVSKDFLTSWYWAEEMLKCLTEGDSFKGSEDAMQGFNTICGDRA